MPQTFDDDPLGSVLEYAVLAQEPDRGARSAWTATNLRHSMVELLEPFGGPAGTLTRSHMAGMLQHGRDNRQVRERLDWAFDILEAHHLFVPYARDDNLNTTYRVVSALGRQLFDGDSYEEFLFGATRIVARRRGSVVRLVGPGGDGIGSGFIVGGTLVATARHVVEDLSDFVVQTEEGVVLPHRAVIRHPRDGIDLALVELAESTGCRPFRLSDEWSLLDPVVVFGYPPIPRSVDAYLVVSKGEIAANPVLYPDEQQIIVISCLLRGGNSGGPVVNSRGEAIGVVSRQLFRQVAPTEASLNESLGLAAATEAWLLRELLIR
jgi:hypothetical protein